MKTYMYLSQVCNCRFLLGKNYVCFELLTNI